MERAIEQVRKQVGGIPLVAGNVATAEGALFLAERGVDAIKVGIGPGGGCTTRLTTNFGVPQAEALVRCRMAVGDRVPLIADGGVKRDGALALALLFGGDSVMLGSAFAGTEETPGEIVLKPVSSPSRRRSSACRSRCFAGWRRSAPFATASISRRRRRENWMRSARRASKSASPPAARCARSFATC